MLPVRVWTGVAQEENAFLNTLLVGDDDYWIGANDRDLEGTFTWSNKQCNSVYTSWSTGEPNGAAAGNDVDGDADCVRMCPPGTSVGYDPNNPNLVVPGGSCNPGEWADYACHAENHYVL